MYHLLFLFISRTCMLSVVVIPRVIPVEWNRRILYSLGYPYCSARFGRTIQLYIMLTKSHQYRHSTNNPHPTTIDKSKRSNSRQFPRLRRARTRRSLVRSLHNGHVSYRICVASPVFKSGHYNLSFPSRIC